MNEKSDDDRKCRGLIEKLNSTMVALEEFGCFASVFEGTLFDVAMNQDGTFDLNDDGLTHWGQTCNPEEPKFLDAVNKHFGTDFRIDQFDGR